MSRLKELIDELCPDGVEYKALGCLTTKPSTIRWSGETEPRRYIDLTSVDIETHCIGETAEVDAATAPSRARQLVATNDVLFATTRPTQMRYCMVPSDYAGEVCSTGFCVLRAKQDIVDSRYLYHSLGSFALQSFLEMRQTEGNYPAISDKDLKDYRIPVPPIEVQREIVRILDTFQELDNSLTAEIEARGREFRSVQESLFDDLNDCMVPLGDYVRFINGRAYKRDELLIDGKYRVLRVGNFFSNDSWYYSDMELDSDKYCQDGDLLYAWSASFGPRIWHGEKTIFHYHIWKLAFDKEQLDRDYLLHFLDLDSRKLKSSTSVTNSTMMHVSMAQMKKRLFPLPDIQRQEAIAHKLNCFASLISELCSERDARRKQFAYYRDKLLDLPEKVTTNG